MPGAEGAGGGCEDIQGRDAAGGGDEARRSAGREEAGADGGACSVDGGDAGGVDEGGRRRDEQSKHPLRVQPCLASARTPLSGDGGGLAVYEVQQVLLSKGYDVEEARGAPQADGFEARVSGCLRLNRRDGGINKIRCAPPGKLLSQTKEAVLESLPVMHPLPRPKEGS